MQSAVENSASDLTQTRLTLLYLDRHEPVLELLAAVEQPETHTAMVHEIPRWLPRVEVVLGALAADGSAEGRGVLCCGLAMLRPGAVAGSDRDRLLAGIEELYRTAQDAGTHSAAGLALRRFGRELPKLPPSDGPEPGRHWFVDRFGQTMTELPGGEFTMGLRVVSFAYEIQNKCTAHRVTMKGGVFLASTEVTRGLFEEFLRDGSIVPLDGIHNWELNWSPDNTRISPSQTHPIQNVQWFETLAFCN